MSDRPFPADDQVLGESLALSGGALATDAIERFVVAHYGIAVTAQALNSERDLIFRLEAADGRAYVLKVAHPSEPAIVTDFQTEALRHIATSAPDLPVQRVVSARSGATILPLTYDDGRSGAARLLTYLPGELLRTAPRSARQRHNLGRLAARLGQALVGFEHPGADHDLPWDIKRAGRLRALVPFATDDPAKRALVLRCLDRFDRHVAPRFAGLRSQVVHNDLNRNNLLIDPADPTRIVGVLDFGDMVLTPLVNDVAVGAANQLPETEDPFRDAIDFIAGYHATEPLAAAELDLLHDLVVTRVVMSVVITEWRAARFPERRDHIRRNTPANWIRLDRLANGDAAGSVAALKRTCGME